MRRKQPGQLSAIGEESAPRQTPSPQERARHWPQLSRGPSPRQGRGRKCRLAFPVMVSGPGRRGREGRSLVATSCPAQPPFREPHGPPWLLTLECSARLASLAKPGSPAPNPAAPPPPQRCSRHLPRAPRLLQLSCRTSCSPRAHQQAPPRMRALVTLWAFGG